MEKDSSDDENDDEDGLPFIPLSRDDKLRIRVIWVNSIIVKPYSKAISNSWLEYKAKSLWKLVVT